jgi:glycosyltransferase involved in cell wall biosynthesis
MNAATASHELSRHTRGTVMNTDSIKSLQIGMHWFPERAGGLDRMYYSLVGALPGAGVAVRGVVAGSPRVAEDTGGAIQGFGSAAQSLPLRLMAARRALRREVTRQRPDVISSHFALYTFPGLDVTRGIPQVSHFQGPWADESHVEGADSFGQRAKRYLEQSVYARSSRLIVLSDAFGKILTSRYGISPERVRVVPGCVNVDQFNLPITPAEARLKLQLPQGRPIVLAVRRLVRRMGLEDLIDAVKLLKQRVPDVLLLIAGKGRLQEELQMRINEAGLDDNVKLLGFVPDQHLAALYRAATISVVPTVALEGFGLITVESLASGTPVLVTPVGGLPEAVAGLSPDLVLPATGAAAIADGLRAALDGSLKLPDADACRAYARANFDNSVIAKRVAAVYGEAIASGVVH